MSPFPWAGSVVTVGSMTAVLQIQPRNPAAPSALSLAGRETAFEGRPLRARSVALALAVGMLVGGLISMSAASGGGGDLTGVEIKTEVVAGG